MADKINAAGQNRLSPSGIPQSITEVPAPAAPHSEPQVPGSASAGNSKQNAEADRATQVALCDERSEAGVATPARSEPVIIEWSSGETTHEILESPPTQEGEQGLPRAPQSLAKQESGQHTLAPGGDLTALVERLRQRRGILKEQ